MSHSTSSASGLHLWEIVSVLTMGQSAKIIPVSVSTCGTFPCCCTTTELRCWNFAVPLVWAPLHSGGVKLLPLDCSSKGKMQ